MPLVIIPARMRSARLPNKPLALIGGDPLILHCWRRAMEADIGPVYVAGDDERIIEVIVRAGGSAVLTGEANCGSDRVAIAAEMVDPAQLHGIVINQQGDMPFISPEHLRSFAREAQNGIRDMATAVIDMGMVEVREDDFFRVTSRLHIGLYAFTREALRRFHRQPQSPRELDARLEQLRAVSLLEIKFIPLSYMPQEVNTPEDLEAANALFRAATAAL